MVDQRREASGRNQSHQTYMYVIYAYGAVSASKSAISPEHDPDAWILTQFTYGFVCYFLAWELPIVEHDVPRPSQLGLQPGLGITLVI